MSTPAIPKPTEMSSLDRILCLEAALMEAASLLPNGVNARLALVIERLLDEHAAPEEFGEYTAAQHKAVATLEAVVKLKDSNLVFGM
tara:strand:- start:195 stop:455 length:261 start_codon:yes stop_codon:yes gene_type:complete